jgi:hypothetical protein
MFKGGGSFFPRLDTFIWDDFTAAYRNRTGFGWEIYFVTASTASSTTWGDYLDTRPHSAFSRTWVGTGFTFNGTNVTPWYLWFGRERDTPEIVLIP